MNFTNCVKYDQLLAELDENNFNPDAINDAQDLFYWINRLATEYIELYNEIKDLISYLNFKALAVSARKDGFISIARQLEDCCQVHYDRLPTDLKW